MGFSSAPACSSSAPILAVSKSKDWLTFHQPTTALGSAIDLLSTTTGWASCVRDLELQRKQERKDVELSTGQAVVNYPTLVNVTLA